MTPRLRDPREKGQTLVLSALAMAVIMGFAALAIDMGLFYEDRRHLQNSADAAALAGIQFLPQQPNTAISTARQWLSQNGVPDSEITSIDVQSTNVANDTLYVEVDRDFNWLFGRAIGLSTSNVGAQAKALVGSLGGNNNMMPWAILQGNSQCLNADGTVKYGNDCIVKVGAGDGINGWYGALDFDGNGGGAAEYLDNIIDGATESRYCIDGDTSAGCASAESTVYDLDGNKTGPTDQGIDTRIANGPTNCDADGSGKEDFDEVFQRNPGPGVDYVVICPTSPRLVIIPIVSYESEPVQKVTIRGWSLAYLDSYICVNGGGGGGGDDGGRGNGSCGGRGHWEVVVRPVDAVYSQSTGFIAAYDEDVGITLRRLIE